MVLPSIQSEVGTPHSLFIYLVLPFNKVFSTLHELVLYLYHTCILLVLFYLVLFTIHYSLFTLHYSLSLLSPFHYSLFTLHYSLSLLSPFHSAWLDPCLVPKNSLYKFNLSIFLSTCLFLYKPPLLSNKRFLVISTGTSSHFWSSTRLPMPHTTQ